SPCSARGSCRRYGEATANGWIAEHTSWTTPGRVSSALRIPPPTVSDASSTVTDSPWPARVSAAARPFGPDPTTTASGTLVVMSPSSRASAHVGGEEVGERLPPDHDPVAPVRHEHHRGSGHLVVVGAHGVAVGARHRRDQEVVDGDVGRDLGLAHQE